MGSRAIAPQCSPSQHGAQPVLSPQLSIPRSVRDVLSRAASPQLQSQVHEAFALTQSALLITSRPRMTRSAVWTLVFLWVSRAETQAPRTLLGIPCSCSVPAAQLFRSMWSCDPLSALCVLVVAVATGDTPVLAWLVFVSRYGDKHCRATAFPESHNEQ